MRKHKYAAIVAAAAVSLACQAAANHVGPAPPQASLASPGGAQPRPEELCERLPEVKNLPFRGGPANDTVHDGLLRYGDAAVPCLIEKLTDTTVMQNPYSTPGYDGFEYRVGDLAYSMLVDISGLPFEEMLSEEAKKEFEAEGVYAYYAYMDDDKNRFEVQNRWREWFEAKQRQQNEPR